MAREFKEIPVTLTAADDPGTDTPTDSPMRSRLTAETEVGRNPAVADPPAGAVWLPGALWSDKRISEVLVDHARVDVLGQRALLGMRQYYFAYCGSRAGSPVDGWTLYVRSAWLMTDRRTGPCVMP